MQAHGGAVRGSLRITLGAEAMIERSWLVEAAIGQMCAKSAHVQNLHTRTGGVEKESRKVERV